MTDSQPRLIGRKEAAAYCGITPTCFSMWVASRKMPPAIPGTRKWDKRAIDAKLDEISGLAINDNNEDDFDRWERLNGGGRFGRSAPNAFEVWKKTAVARDKHRPLHNLDAREMRVLRCMIVHPECKTVEAIPQAGDKTMQAMAKVGVVSPGSKDARGLREWFVTDEGRAEIKRSDTWVNWRFG